jgi:hypothetical protein
MLSKYSYFSELICKRQVSVSILRDRFSFNSNEAELSEYLAMSYSNYLHPKKLPNPHLQSQATDFTFVRVLLMAIFYFFSPLSRKYTANLNEVPFDIDHFSGSVRTSKLLDYETMRKEYVLHIRVSPFSVNQFTRSPLTIHSCRHPTGVNPTDVRPR